MKRVVRRAGQLPFYVKRGIAERREEKRSAAEQAEKKERAAVKTPSWTQKKITDFPMKPLGAVTRPVSNDFPGLCDEEAPISPETPEPKSACALS